MAFIEWNNSFSVGIELCDDQHKGLINILNDLHTAMKQGKGSDILESTISQLADYTETHFKTEEDLFTKHSYPDKEKHTLEHDKLTNKVLSFLEEYKKGQILLSVELLQFLKNWLFEHISVLDKAYSQFLNERGVS